MSNHIPRQHIQDHDTATSVEPHWGYPDRVVPCANDQGTCEYLDAVYHMHDLSMLYTFILWAVLGGLLSILVVVRVFRPRQGSEGNVDGTPRDAEGLASKVDRSTALRIWRAIVATANHYLLPESFTDLFGHVSTVQLVALAGLLVYLLIFS
jgi:hypothetical protein